MSDDNYKTIGILVLLVIAFYIGYNSGNNGYKVEENYDKYFDIDLENYESDHVFNIDEYTYEVIERYHEDSRDCLSSIINDEAENYDEGFSIYSFADYVVNKYDENCIYKK